MPSMTSRTGRTIYRPFHMLYKWPILTLVTIYLSIVYGILYGCRPPVQSIKKISTHFYFSVWTVDSPTALSMERISARGGTSLWSHDRRSLFSRGMFRRSTPSSLESAFHPIYRLLCRHLCVGSIVPATRQIVSWLPGALPIR